MTRITEVRARAICIPLDVQTSLSSRTMNERHYGLVEIDCDDGTTGIGFCYVGSAGGRIFPEVVSTLFSGLLAGRDPFEVEALWQDMYQHSVLHGRTGVVMRAISALDIALWDRNSKSVGLPLYKFLGASRSGTVPAYASGGYYVEGKTPKLLADEMEQYVEQGFDAVKMKVGRLASPREEEARLAAVRERVGPDVKIMLDANNAWSDLPTALSFIRRFEEYDPYFIEEPFSPDDIPNHARLAALTSIPVATGEIEVGRWRFQELMQAGGAMILQTDACVCGGITEFKRIAATAASFGLTLMPHWFHDVHVHLVAATPNATYVEFFPDDQVLNFRRLVDRQLAAQGGQLMLSDAPGLGFGLIKSEVERYAASDWSR